MFVDIAPLIRERGVMLTIVASTNRDDIVLTIIPKPMKEGETGPALTPLQLKGSPEDLDAGFSEAFDAWKDSRQSLMAQVEAQNAAAAAKATTKTASSSATKTTTPAKPAAKAPEPPKPPNLADAGSEWDDAPAQSAKTPATVAPLSQDVPISETGSTALQEAAATPLVTSEPRKNSSDLVDGLVDGPIDGGNESAGGVSEEGEISDEGIE